MSLSVQDVERWMVTAERADPRVRNPGEERPLRWPDQFVENVDHRRALKLWIWCEARGYSYHDVCKRRGLKYTTANRHRRAAVERITMLLALERALVADGYMVA